MPSNDNDPNLEETIREVVASMTALLHTMEFGKIKTFDASKNPPRADIELAVRRKRYNDDGELENYDPPVLTDVPITYPVMGGASVYAELSPGDEVLVTYAERNVDNAIEVGEDLNDPATPRRHSENDATAQPFSWSSGPASDQRGTGLILDHASLIKLGKAATQFATTANKVQGRFLAWEIWAASHVHSDPVSGVTSSPTVSPPTTTLDMLEADKVKVE